MAYRSSNVISHFQFILTSLVGMLCSCLVLLCWAAVRLGCCGGQGFFERYWEHSRLMGLVGLEGDLQDAVAQPIAVQAGDGHGCLVVVRHGDEAEALALVGVEVADHLDIVDSAEGPEQLPQDALV